MRPEWVHEIKWDGYRVSAYLQDGEAAIYTRNGQDRAHCYPAITASVAALPLHSAVIDGEAVMLDDEGRSSFSALQGARNGGRSVAKQTCNIVKTSAPYVLTWPGMTMQTLVIDDGRMYRMRKLCASVLFAAGLAIAFQPVPAAAWYCAARSNTGATGWGRSFYNYSARYLALSECSIRTPRYARCRIQYCVL